MHSLKSIVVSTVKGVSMVCPLRRNTRFDLDLNCPEMQLSVCLVIAIVYFQLFCTLYTMQIL